MVALTPLLSKEGLGVVTVRKVSYLNLPGTEYLVGFSK
jgi:hypothetical protein